MKGKAFSTYDRCEAVCEATDICGAALFSVLWQGSKKKDAGGFNLAAAEDPKTQLDVACWLAFFVCTNLNLVIINGNGNNETASGHIMCIWAIRSPKSKQTAICMVRALNWDWVR